MSSAWVVEPCIISSFLKMAGKEAGLATESFLSQIKLQSWLLIAIYFLNIRNKNKLMILPFPSLQPEISRRVFPPTEHCRCFSDIL